MIIVWTKYIGPNKNIYSASILSTRADVSSNYDFVDFRIFQYSYTDLLQKYIVT